MRTIQSPANLTQPHPPIMQIRLYCTLSGIYYIQKQGYSMAVSASPSWRILTIAGHEVSNALDLDTYQSFRAHQSILKAACLLDNTMPTICNTIKAANTTRLNAIGSVQ